MDIWHHLRGLSKASLPRNLEFSNKMVILHEVQQFRMIVWSQKCNSTNFRFPGAFCMTMRNFCMVMQNQFWDFPLVCNTNALWSISHDCKKFSHDHAKWTYTSSLACNQFSSFGSFRMIMQICNIWFLSFLLSFLPFLLLIPLPPISSNPSPNQLHYFFHYALGSS